LLKAEQSSLAESNFKFQTGKVLRIVLYVYLGLTIAETITLRIFGMNFFDALLHSFGTVATGGFSTKNMSIAYYNSVAIEITVIVFMVLSGIHFGFLYTSIIRRRFNIFSSYVVRYYIISMTVGILVVAFFLYFKGFYSLPDAFRYSSFQVASVATTTGFATADTVNWAGFAQMILIFFTLQCACSGSTSGGIKVDRVVLFFKYIRTLVVRMFHPNAVVITRLDGEAVESDIIQNSLLFIALYLLIVFISALLLTAFDVDMITSFSASIATMGNVGPGLGHVSSMANYSTLPDMAKWILTLNMLMGRLEIYGFIALIMWKSLK
jgi:trk system potassium uptake protein TrkH